MHDRQRAPRRVRDLRDRGLWGQEHFVIGWTADEPTTLVALWITVEDVVEIGPSDDGTDVEYHLTHRFSAGHVERLRCLGATVITSVERADR